VAEALSATCAASAAFLTRLPSDVLQLHRFIAAERRQNVAPGVSPGLGVASSEAPEGRQIVLSLSSLRDSNFLGR